MRVFIKFLFFLFIASTASAVVDPDYSPLPDDYRPNLSPLPVSKLRSITNDFNIAYVADGETDYFNTPCITFPADKKAALIRATEIWSSYIVTNVPIKIEACWTSSIGITLGRSGSSATANFTNAQANTYYAYALANALAEEDVRPAKSDIHLALNSTSDWYIGLDGNTPDGDFDLLSVNIHEIAHSLNFSGMMEYDAGTGKGSYGAYPDIWDRHIVDASNNSILNAANDSVALGNKLTSQALYFSGTKANAANGGNKVKIYAPSTWKDGSSYSHLDYDTFNNTVNDLMVHLLTDGEANHNPGPIALAILEDLGWTMESLDIPCAYGISPLENYIPKAGATKTVTITSSPFNCNSGSWSVSENLSWVTLSGDTQGSSSGTWNLNYTVPASYTGRIGAVDIANNTHKINQPGLAMVYDERSKLYWQDEEYTANEVAAYNTAQGEHGKVLRWDNALQYCKDLNYAHFDDWHLPTKTQLESIVNASNSPTVESAFYYKQAGHYWTSTVSPTNSLFVYAIDFSTATTGIDHKGYNGYIRCVRKPSTNAAIIMYLLN